MSPPAEPVSTALLFGLSWTHSRSSLALLGFCGLYLCLILMLASLRAALTVTGRRRANDFDPHGEGEGPFTRRLMRAHANMTEAFPLWGLLLLAIATGQTEVTDGLALHCLGARLGQVLTHLISTSERAVTLRFCFFIAQLMIFAVWIGHFVVLGLP